MERHMDKHGEGHRAMVRGVEWPVPGQVLPPFDAWRSAAVAADVIQAQHAGAQALEQRRARRLAALLKAAAASSPLYRDLLRGRDAARLRLDELPPMRKADLMGRFEAWVGDPALRLDALRRFTADPARIADPFLGRYVVWESSGSSGEPAIFVQDAAAMAVYDALEALRRPLLRSLQRWLDPWQLGERLAFVGATGGHFASTVSVERLRRLNPALRSRLHGVSFLQPVAALVDELNALAPTVIATYPGAAVLLAEERRAGRLRFSPAEVWTGGETLTAPMKRCIEEAFGCPVVNSYGASEFLSLACACGQGSLHLNSDWAILESVDAHGAPVAADTPGATVLLTNLANHVQPLIRYDLGDRVTLRSAACACGSALPVIEVQGRSDDTLRLGARGAHPVSMLALAVSTVLEDDAGLFDFQLIQQGPCALLLTTALDGPSATAALRRGRAALAAFIAAQGVAGVEIHCRSGAPRRPGRSGKLQRVIALPG
jgi:phenylacetate-coenzyme A ligase PaaK-like adenylate-forming protein